MRMRLHGAAVFVAQRADDEGPSLYSLAFDGSPLVPRRIVKGDASTTLGEVAIDTVAKTALYIVDRGESAVGKTGEIWAVPLKGGEPNRVARCTTSCRGAAFLNDGRVVYVDHATGLTNATVRVVRSRPNAPLDNAVLFGGSKELATCSITLGVDLDARRLVVNVNNELGWECATDATWVLGPRDTTPLKLPRPATVSGYCSAIPGDDGRIYVTGTECSPQGSIGADGTDVRFPDANLVGGAVPATQWSLRADEGRILAIPPTKSSDLSFVVLEIEKLGSLAYRAR